MRLFPGLLGVLMVPIAYLTMRNMRVSNAASLLTAMLVLFDNALTAQSRLILLDSFLLFFSGLSAWMWSEFKVREIHPFSAGWWISLFMTGVSLGLAVSVKWVGLFVIALVGVATVSDLWALACNPRVQVVSLFALYRKQS